MVNLFALLFFQEIDECFCGLIELDRGNPAPGPFCFEWVQFVQADHICLIFLIQDFARTVVQYLCFLVVVVIDEMGMSNYWNLVDIFHGFDFAKLFPVQCHFTFNFQICHLIWLWRLIYWIFQNYVLLNIHATIWQIFSWFFTISSKYYTTQCFDDIFFWFFSKSLVVLEHFHILFANFCTFFN